LQAASETAEGRPLVLLQKRLACTGTTSAVVNETTFFKKVKQYNMPKQKNNIVMKTTSGMFGKQVVFKERAGESYVSAPPQVNENREPTDKQVEGQQRFRESIEYASDAIKDPVLKKGYQAKAKRSQSAQNVAFQDAYHAPVVHEIVGAGYRGQVGDVITVVAEDDFKVTAVKVSIYDADGELLEEGNAIAGKKFNWMYTVTQPNANVAGSTIKAIAFDLPGNEGTLQVTV
jgi:hypothetical protein